MPVSFSYEIVEILLAVIGFIFVSAGGRALWHLYQTYVKRPIEKYQSVNLLGLATPWLILMAFGVTVAISPLLVKMFEISRTADIAIAAYKYTNKNEKSPETDNTTAVKDKKQENPQSCIGNYVVNQDCKK